MPLPLSGLLVVSLEEGVAAPMCTCRLADAGARVIKVERPEGDFARYYDKLAVPRAAMAANCAATTSQPAAPASSAPLAAHGKTHAAPASPPPLAGEGQGGGMRQDSGVQAHPLPTPPPPLAGEGAYRVRGEDAQRDGQSAYFVWLNRGNESVVPHIARPA